MTAASASELPTTIASDADFTLYVGDAVRVLRSLPDDSVACCITSPPYEDMRAEYPSPTHAEFDSIFLDLARVVRNDGAFLLNVGRRWQSGIEKLWWRDLLDGAWRAGWELLDTLIWAKPNANPIRGRFLTDAHEYVFVFGTSSTELHTDAVRTPYSPETLSRTERNWGRGSAVKHSEARKTERAGLNPLGARPRSYITIHTGREKGNEHPAPMALELAEHLVKLASSPGDTVLDPFAGSGTTNLAARRLGRKSIGIELDPRFARIAARRLGQQSLFAEVAA